MILTGQSPLFLQEVHEFSMLDDESDFRNGNLQQYYDKCLVTLQLTEANKMDTYVQQYYHNTTTILERGQHTLTQDNIP